MKSVPITSLAIVFAAVTSLPASARDVKLGPVINNPEIRIRGVPNNGCTMYEHLNGGGESWKAKVNWKFRAVDGMTIYREVYNETGPYWNDKISSVRCDLKCILQRISLRACQSGRRPTRLHRRWKIDQSDGSGNRRLLPQPGVRQQDIVLSCRLHRQEIATLLFPTLARGISPPSSTIITRLRRGAWRFEFRNARRESWAKASARLINSTAAC